MPNRTYKLLEVVGISEDSINQAVENAVTRAASTLSGIGWFEVTQIRGLVRESKVSEFQVTVKIGFRLMDATEVKKAKRTRRTSGAAGTPDAWVDDHF
jgi:flavin-binding protein dodecin